MHIASRARDVRLVGDHVTTRRGSIRSCDHGRGKIRLSGQGVVIGPSEIAGGQRRKLLDHRQTGTLPGIAAVNKLIGEEHVDVFIDGYDFGLISSIAVLVRSMASRRPATGSRCIHADLDRSLLTGRRTGKRRGDARERRPRALMPGDRPPMKSPPGCGPCSDMDGAPLLVVELTLLERCARPHKV
jgi:hypothetical protein